MTAEQVKKAKEWDLLSYLNIFETQELVHISGDYYSTKTHDSVIIHNGNWTRYATGDYGKTALSYLTYVMGRPFKDMVLLLSGGTIERPTVSVPTLSNLPTKELILPIKSKYNDNVIRYLKSRGISDYLIKFCLKQELIYEEHETRNIVFVGRDEMGINKYAACRGTSKKRFFKEASGSDKRFSFFLPSKEDSDTLNIFESAIDLLSYCTLQEKAGKDCFCDNNLSLGGIYIPKKHGTFKLPLALDRYLSISPQIQNIRLYLDNDDKGQRAAKAIYDKLSPAYNVRNYVLSECKDMNDFLFACLKKRQTKERECTEIYR